MCYEIHFKDAFCCQSELNQCLCIAVSSMKYITLLIKIWIRDDVLNLLRSHHPNIALDEVTDRYHYHYNSNSKFNIKYFDRSRYPQ